MHKEYVRAYLASAKGKAAMKRYRNPPRASASRAARKKVQRIAQGKGSNEEVPAIRQGRAVNRTAKKSTSNRPREGLTLQALRERNKEHQKAYRESPRAGHGLRSRMGK